MSSYPAIAPRLSDASLKAAHRLRDVCAATGRVNYKRSQLLTQAWDAAHSEQTRLWAEHTFSCARSTAENAKISLAGQSMKESKPVFNHEYTPLLEKYFEYNAYPSAPDRAVLARKSMMTPRQIEVWFQNHRNRARKDGKPLRKMIEDPLPLEISLKTLERKMPFYIIPEHKCKSVNRSESLKDNVDEKLPPIASPVCNPTSPDVLNPPGPSHAFPMVYPPRYDENPFPILTGTHTFPALTWFRRPAAPRRTIKISVDVDELIEEFEMKLHLRVPTTKQQRSRPSQSWCAGRVTVPSPAPHPAFVRCPLFSTSRPASRLPVVPAPYSRLHPFSTPSPYSQPTTLILPQHFNDTPAHRKVARLPRRTPQNTCISHRRGSSPLSESSPPPSRAVSSASCSSSLGSDTASDRRLLSSSSSASSSAVTTPVLAHSKSPEEARSPVSILGIDTESTDDLFGGRETLLPVEEETPNLSRDIHPKHPLSLGLLCI